MIGLIVLLVAASAVSSTAGAPIDPCLEISRPQAWSCPDDPCHDTPGCGHCFSAYNSFCFSVSESDIESEDNLCVTRFGGAAALGECANNIDVSVCRSH